MFAGYYTELVRQFWLRMRLRERSSINEGLPGEVRSFWFLGLGRHPHLPFTGIGSCTVSVRPLLFLFLAHVLICQTK